MKIYDVGLDGENVPHVMIMETIDKFALAPFEQREDCKFIDYTKVKIYDKEAPEYPLEAVESFKKD